MIQIPALRSERINARMCELSIRAQVDLASLPAVLGEEQRRSYFLRAAVTESFGKVSDPADWTVQERIWAVATYLGGVGEDPNFWVGSEARLADYLYTDDPSRPESVDLAEFGAEGYSLKHMLGKESEIVETVCRTRFDWTLADMAVRLVRSGEPARPCPKQSPGEFQEWLTKTMSVYAQFAGSDFDQLWLAYRTGMSELDHLFRLVASEAGFLCIPKQRQGVSEQPAPQLPLGRFPVPSCIGQIARSLAG